MNRFEEVVRAKNRRTAQDNELLSVLLKTMLNVCAERANEPSLYNDNEIYSKVQSIVEDINTNNESLSDVAASMATEMFPELNQNRALIKAGTRINWNGEIKKATVDLWDTLENNPDNAPALWESVMYRQGYRIIPEVITSTSAFAANEIGWWGNELFKSLINSNVWTPDVLASGWEKII